MKRSGTLFVSDLDGTLLDSDARLSDNSVRLLNEAISGGALFTIATARTPATVDVLLSKVNINIPAIVLTGAALWNFDTRTYSDLRFISPSDADIITDIFSDCGVAPFVYTLDSSIEPHVLRVYYPSAYPGKVDAKFIADRSHLSLKRFCIGALPPASRADSRLLFYASGPRDALLDIERSVSRHTDCATSCYEDIYNPGTALIEIFAPGVSKAEAISRLSKKLGVERVVVFGDNLNDLPMFEVADTSIAVANALPEVRGAAAKIIGANTSDAVAQYVYTSTTGEMFGSEC